VLDAAIHMRAAALAGVTLDHRRRIDDLQLVAVLEHGHVLAGHHRDHRERCALRFPAFGAPASVVLPAVPLHAHLHRPVRAFADEGSAGKIARALLYAVVDRWMELSIHGQSSCAWYFVVGIPA